MDTKPASLAELATLFARDERWAAWILGGLGVPLDPDGTFDATVANNALERAIQRLSSARSLPRPDWVTVAEMGTTEESCRQWFISQLERHGMEVTGRSLRRGARMTVRLPGGKQTTLLTYVALTTKPSGQVGFTASYLDDPHVDWFVFIAKDFGKAYLRRKHEIIERLRTKKKVRTAAVTFSEGSDADLLEHRLPELAKG
jgi:hypothetical protein